MQTFDEFLKNSPVTAKVESTSGLPSFGDYLKTAPPPEPAKPSLMTKIVSGVKSYAEESANTVTSFGEKILHPVKSLNELPGVFVEPLMEGEKKAGEALYNLTSGLKTHEITVGTATGPKKLTRQYIDITDPQTIANTAHFVSGLAQAAFSPITGLFKLAQKTPGAKQVADVINLPFTASGIAGSWSTGKAIDWIPDSTLPKESKDVIKEPLKELGSLAFQTLLGGKIMEKVGDFARDKKVVTPEEARKIVAVSQQEAHKIAIETPGSRYADYRKSQGYEPYTPDNQLPTIEMGNKPKVAESIPTIEAGAPESNKIGSLRYEPIKNPTPPTFEQFKNDVKTQTAVVESAAPIKKETPVIKSAEVKPFEASDSKTSKLSSDLADTLAKSGITPNKAEMATYKTEENFMKNQADRALKLIQESPEQAKRIAMGEEDAPAGLKNESVFKALGKTAHDNGDFQTVLDLSRSKVATEASIKGQDIKALDVGDHSHDPVKIIKDIQTSREQIAEKSAKKPVSKAKKAITDEIHTEIKKITPTKQSWSEFVDQIKCNY